MSKLRDLLSAYAHYPSSENMFALAEEYYALGQYAGAHSFYLRTAEHTEDKNIMYYSLIRCGQCFNVAGNRKHSVMTLYKHAVNLLPDRPEAYYFLSKVYHDYGDWFDSYTFACLGLEKPIIDDIFSRKLSCNNKYYLLYHKGVAAWHIGRSFEARQIIHGITKNYYQVLDPEYSYLVAKYGLHISAGPLGICNIPYWRGMKLRYEFKDWLRPDRNYSQVCQDLFVLSMLDGKKKGTYLEIGSGDAFHLNNTVLLERDFEWTGKGVDWNEMYSEGHKQKRSNEVLCEDALKIDYVKLLNSITNTGIVDYLQLDAEPSRVTYEIMTKIPFDQFKFRVITYEHDHYVDITQSVRDKARVFLQSKGYKLVVNDVVAGKYDFCPFEDWWVHPDLVDKNILDIMLDDDLTKPKLIEKYMFK